MGRQETRLVHFLMLFVMFFTGIPMLAHAPPPVNSEPAAIVAWAQKAAVQALDFRPGDVVSPTRAPADFTAEGSEDFRKGIEGWLDQRGAQMTCVGASTAGQ
jgi:hypothetical protein